MSTRIVSRRSPPGLRVLRTLLVVAVLVSIVHYVDNVANYADYPVPSSGPAPSREQIGTSWFVFTGFGATGLFLFARRQGRLAAACLAVYSLSGLVGLGHYTVPGALEMPWWRQLHIVGDVGCGIAVLAFAVWALRRGDGPAAEEQAAP